MTSDLQGALSVLKRGLSESAELRRGLGYTVAFAMVGAVGALLIPVLVQLIIDRGLLGGEGFRPGFVYTACALAAIAIVVVYASARFTYIRMVRASEGALKSLRIRTFDHIHRLSIAEQTNERRGTFVSRVTSDIETLSQFMEWGALVWITGSTLALGTLAVMLFYSWRLTVVVVVVVAPLYFVLKRLQRGMLAAYDAVRTRVAEMLSELSESLMGAAVIRAYDYDARMDERVKGAIDRRYRAQIFANRYQASIFPISDIFGACAIAAVLGVGAWLGPGWGMTSGELVAFMFLVSLFVQPLGELSETFDHTQTAIAGWRKVLGVLDIPIDIQEPDPGRPLPRGALSVEARGVHFSYVDGQPVLGGVDMHLEPGTRAAIVGETGCGKTTFAKLLARLADPTQGYIRIGGIDLREVTRDSRRDAIKMVPQDGFLFDATIADNVRFGRVGATDQDVKESFESLGLGGWISSLVRGIDTPAGQRGSNLSVGECQLVALARAQVANPGLLILDEATSAVDPETESALAGALQRLAEGRTTITIAHRLSTAESAEVIFVFDRGVIVERGRHEELLAIGGVYAELYRSWLGNTRTTERPSSGLIEGVAREP